MDINTLALFSEYEETGEVTFISPKEFVPSLLLRQQIDDRQFDKFCSCLEVLAKDLVIGEENKQLESYFEAQLIQFFQAIGYSGKYNVSPTDRSDFSIHSGVLADSPVASIIEVKRPSNESEMCSVNDMNKKALHEAITYLFKEVVDKSNLEVKTVIVTNGWEWFFFDAQTIWSALNRTNNKYVNLYKKYRANKLTSSGADAFYKSVMSNAVDDLIHLKQLISCHINLKEFFKAGKLNKINRLKEIYQLLLPETLIDKEVSNDSNVLNKDFYNELLYIMGLEEIKEKVDGQEKVVIKRAKKPQYHSLLESAIRLSSYSHPGLSQKELFEPALEIILQWVNRIIFLKLLETQLVNFHDGDERYKFLTATRFKTFDEVADLFFGVLAIPKDKRNPKLRTDFSLIPYLNSGLFELTDKEKEYVRIGEVKDGLMDPYPKTILLDSATGKNRTKPIPNLEYLLSFLDCYDFGQIQTKKSQSNEHAPKQLINAAVLGLIFEKINGYKEGSVFTPGVVTSFMCKRTLRTVVRKKLNKTFGWSCKDWYSLVETVKEDIKDRVRTRQEIASVIDSLKICDIAVGSGHFLVSALNQLLVIKDELRVLLDEDGRVLPVDISCINDELVIYDDEQQELFRYNYKNERKALIQKTLFHQKQHIIENCLFGVDINPKSVQICQLRLWTELLKSTYYKTPEDLETLPNLDTNIRVGNSLVSMIDVQVGKTLEDTDSDIKTLVANYKRIVSEYKIQPDKALKRKVKSEIQNIRESFKKLSYGQGNVDLQDAVSTEDHFENAFEWMIEFPETLSDEGVFQGFDCILANPPYMRVQGLVKVDNHAKLYYDNHYKVAVGSYDLANLFIERAMKLSAPTGYNSFIFPHKFLNSANGTVLRTYLKQSRNVHSIVHFGANQVFQGVITYTCILDFSPESSDAIDFSFFRFKQDYEKQLSGNLTSNKVTYSSLTAASVLYGSDQWILFPTVTDQRIFKKIYQNSFKLGQAVKIFQGIPTSKDDLYILDRLEDGRYQVPLTGKIYTLEDTFIKPYVRGKDVHRFETLGAVKYIFFPYIVKNDVARPVTLEELKSSCPLTYKYVMDNESEFKARESKKAAKKELWYEYLYPKSLTEYEKPRISSMEICSNYPNLAWNPGIYHGTKVYSWLINSDMESRISNYYLLGIGNSKLMWWFLKLTGDTLASDSRTMKTNYLSPFPIPLDPNPSIKESIENLVKERLACQDTMTSINIEQQINDKVCELYGITDEEKEVIDAAY